MNNSIRNISQEKTNESPIDVKVINVHEEVVLRKNIFEIIDYIQELMTGFFRIDHYYSISTKQNQWQGY